jgi:hypothetical protein
MPGWEANVRGDPRRRRPQRRLRLLLAVAATTLGLLVLGVGAAGAHDWDGWHWPRGGAEVDIYFYLTSPGGCGGGYPQTNAMYDIWNNPHPVYNWCVDSHSDVSVFEGYSSASWCGLATVWARWWDPWNNHIDHGHAQYNTRCTSGAGYSGNAFKQGIYCQEIAHTLGQEHSATGDCMNFGYFSWDQPYQYRWGNTGLYVWDWDHNSADLYYRYRYH